MNCARCYLLLLVKSLSRHRQFDKNDEGRFCKNIPVAFLDSADSARSHSRHGWPMKKKWIRRMPYLEPPLVMVLNLTVAGYICSMAPPTR